jgi:pimeloyl-ACP methyl ester carboxylesterase
MPTANLGEVKIYYEEHGRGDPMLLVLPSWWTCDTWKVVVVPELSRRYRTIIFDCRGTGRSSRPDGGYTVSQFARDSIALLEHIGISRCHVVGFALGGTVAQAMAIERPELFATLTMAATGPGEQSRPGGLGKAIDDEDRKIRENGFERYIRSHVENDSTAFSAAFYREHRETVTSLGQALWNGQTRPEDLRGHHEARGTWDTIDNAARVQVPTLVLVGGADDVARGNSTPVTTARQLAELVPGAELALIPGAKHIVFWDGMGAIECLENFLARHPIAGV